MSIKEIIESTLAIPVVEGIDVLLPDKCATVFFYNLGNGLAGDGKEAESVESVQVDLHYRDTTEAAIRAAATTLRTALQANLTCSIPAVSYEYNSGNRFWRATLDFETL